MSSNHPDPHEPEREIINELIACLSGLADSGLSAESTNSVREALQKTEQLSQQMLERQDKLEADLQRAQQERNEFISVVTHELRLPMTSIKGYTDLLRQGVVGTVNQQQLGFLDTIRSNVDRMAALLSDLSDISRIDTGRIKIDITAVSLEQPIETAMQILKPVWEKKGQSLEVSLPPDLEPVAADQNRLTQVITNMLRNAIMYTPDGGRIRIRSFSDGEHVHFEIADSGIGIKAEDQVRLFSPFFRSDDIYVREQPGWGISLHVSAKLIRIMDGSIGMHGAPENGSVFWFSLPQHRSN